MKFPQARGRHDYGAMVGERLSTGEVRRAATRSVQPVGSPLTCDALDLAASYGQNRALIGVTRADVSERPASEIIRATGRWKRNHDRAEQV